MLKGISPILSPELLKILMEMGHGDEIVIGDGNFPAASIAQRLVRLDGHGVPEILDAILALMPLDTYVEAPVGLMQVVPGDDVVPEIWEEYRALVKKHEGEKKFEESSASPSTSAQRRPMPSLPAAKRPFMPISSSKKAL